ncbi:hypothetical protein M8818_006662 [Zalaria obscura]|uniref:Uncharacterized protein n=1 Tax=Zalaria obscura TaxID=2024903 RepID=A0ACC3S7L6_9PEZI
MLNSVLMSSVVLCHAMTASQLSWKAADAALGFAASKARCVGLNIEEIVLSWHILSYSLYICLLLSTVFGVGVSPHPVRRCCPLPTAGRVERILVRSPWRRVGIRWLSDIGRPSWSLAAV